MTSIIFSKEESRERTWTLERLFFMEVLCQAMSVFIEWEQIIHIKQLISQIMNDLTGERKMVRMKVRMILEYHQTT